MIPVRTDDDQAACAVDRACSGSTCGCHPVTETGHTARVGSEAPTPRRGVTAALLAAACVAACLAVPLGAAGLAAVSGAATGQWWLVAGIAILAVAMLTIVGRRRGGRIC